MAFAASTAAFAPSAVDAVFAVDVVFAGVGFVEVDEDGVLLIAKTSPRDPLRCATERWGHRLGYRRIRPGGAQKDSLGATYSESSLFLED